MTANDAPRPSRRAVLGTGGALLASLAGCAGLLGDDTPDTQTRSARRTPRSGTAGAGTDGPSPTSTATGTPRRTEPLHLQTTAELLRVGSRLAHEWNANRSPAETSVWSAAAETLGTDARMADYFAAEHGIEPTETRSEPPFGLLTSVSRSEPIARDIAASRVDAGETDRESIETVASEVSDWPGLLGHTVAHEGQAFVVSAALAEAGVTRLTAEEIRDIYNGAVESWAAVGGPDREPYVIAGATGTPDPRICQDFFGRQPMDGVDTRFGQHRERGTLVRRRDDAIAYLGAGMAVGGVPAPTVVVDGTGYDVRDPGYPTTYPAKVYTRGRPDAREAAVVDALTSPVGRQFVGYERDLVVAAD